MWPILRHSYKAHRPPLLTFSNYSTSKRETQISIVPLPERLPQEHRARGGDVERVLDAMGRQHHQLVAALLHLRVDPYQLVAHDDR